MDLVLQHPYSVTPVEVSTYKPKELVPTNSRASRKLFQKQTARMDWDTTREVGFDKLINAFVEGDTKILVGTQMVVKGLDFQNVHL